MKTNVILITVFVYYDGEHKPYVCLYHEDEHEFYKLSLSTMTLNPNLIAVFVYYEGEHESYLLFVYHEVKSPYNCFSLS